MSLSEEEVKSVKEQLMQMIDKMPPEQQGALREQITAMNAEQLEEFLIKNNMIKGPDGANPQGNTTGGCIFCALATGKSPSYIMGGNDVAVAILDINPLSKAHVLVIPKEHKKIEEVPKTQELAKEIGIKLKEKFKAKEVKIEINEVQGHGIINVIPIYDDSKLERRQATPEELASIQREFTAEVVNLDKDNEDKKEVPLEKLPHAPNPIP